MRNALLKMTSCDGRRSLRECIPLPQRWQARKSSATNGSVALLLHWSEKGPVTEEGYVNGSSSVVWGGWGECPENIGILLNVASTTEVLGAKVAAVLIRGEMSAEDWMITYPLPPMDKTVQGRVYKLRFLKVEGTTQDGGDCVVADKPRRLATESTASRSVLVVGAIFINDDSVLVWCFKLPNIVVSRLDVTYSREFHNHHGVSEKDLHCLEHWWITNPLTPSM